MYSEVRLSLLCLFCGRIDIAGHPNITIKTNTIKYDQANLYDANDVKKHGFLPSSRTRKGAIIVRCSYLLLPYPKGVIVAVNIGVHNLHYQNLLLGFDYIIQKTEQNASAHS